MTRWKYLFVTAERSSENLWVVSSENGKRIKSPIPLDNFIQQAGEQGWELVSENSEETQKKSYSWFGTEVMSYEEILKEYIANGYDLIAVSVDDITRYFFFCKTTVQVYKYCRFKRPKEEKD